MDKLNLTVTINTQRPDKKGKYAIRIRSCIKRKVSYYATGFNVFKEHFKNGEVIKAFNRIEINTAIRKQIHDIEKDYIEGGLNVPGKKIDFYTFSEKKINQQKGKDSHGTWKHKKSYLNKLKEFKATLQFSEITPSFMLDFENYCRELGNKPTTVWSSVKFVKTMVNAALNDNVITSKPMRGYKSTPYVNPVRPHLTFSEIDRLEKFVSENKNETLVKVANWFLFGCYCGLRYADVRKFDKRNIVEGRIFLRPGKGQTDVSIKLHARLLNVIERMSLKVMTNQKVNDYLKVIAASCNIEKNLTFHVSRHTFAVYFLNKGGSMETLSKLLGHKKLTTTAIYGKIVDIRTDSEMDKVWG